MLNDLRFCLRLFRRSPGFVVVAMVTLAVGIGINTAIFSIFDAVLLRPLPYPQSDRLVPDLGDDPESRRPRRRLTGQPDGVVRVHVRVLRGCGAASGQWRTG